MIKLTLWNNQNKYEVITMLDFRAETFLAVCKYMNFTHAADALNLTSRRFPNILNIWRTAITHLYSYGKTKS